MSFHSLPSVAFAQVDWHDFVVVETVDFKDSETGWHFFFNSLIGFDFQKKKKHTTIALNMIMRRPKRVGANGT